MTVYQPTPEEYAKYQQLNELMGGDLDSARGLEVLRQTGGDITKAVDIIFSAVSSDAEVQHVETASTSAHSSAPFTPTPLRQTAAPNVIDLTAGETEDEELQRALQISRGDTSGDIHQPQFGPSERGADANWSMVPASATSAAATQNNEDRALQDVLAASYQDSMIVDQAEELNMEDLVRQPEAPVSVRVEPSSLAYTTAVLHALFFTPQVRQVISKLRPPAYVDRYSVDDNENALWNLIELFSYMDYSCINVLDDEKAILSLRPALWTVDATPEYLCKTLYTQIARLIEESYARQCSDTDPDRNRIFHFEHVTAQLIGGKPQLTSQHKAENDCVVIVNTGSNQPSGNDLLSRLTDVMALYREPESPQEALQFNAISNPSQLLAFELSHMSTHVGGFYQASAVPTHDGFRYPKSFFLDQFLMQNVETAVQIRDARLEMLADIRQCHAKRNLLTRFEDSDVLGNLRSNIHYFEHIAIAKDAPDRPIAPDGMADRLKRIAEKLEDEVAAIDQRILAVEGQLSQLHNTPALQNVKYDLRAVIVHTGMPGRKSVYTYVQDGREQWWKMVEAQVTEVDEATVLTDPTGMQLGAGPLLLIYSRAISAEERWDMEHCRYHEHFMSNVLQCNAQYFEKLPDDVKARIEATWGSADAFVRRGMPAQALSPGRTASPSMSMPVDSTPPRGVSRLDGPPPRSDSLPKSAAHTMSPTHTMSPAQGMSPMHTGSPKQSSVHRQALRKNSAATTRDAIMRDPPLQHRDASARDVPPHQAREGRDAPPHQPHRDASMGRTDGPHGPREASMGRSSPSLSRDASMPAS